MKHNDCVELQRHRDQWREYAYGKGNRPPDYLDGNGVDRGPTRIETLQGALGEVQEELVALKAEAARTDRIHIMTNISSDHDDGGCLDLIIDRRTRRAVGLCNECGREMGRGTLRDQGFFALDTGAEAFLDGAANSTP